MVRGDFVQFNCDILGTHGTEGKYGVILGVLPQEDYECYDCITASGIVYIVVPEECTVIDL
ncbi:hypothetical protein M2323_004689 [Rhodoblastus acidophilus]|uniref:hypothetical protein n=1 Tax=Rhodoblastus acidophilus TaxID=1074 RepID=UPI0022241B06|nr:hypothetical protein [Rhodoblastus acidophilus]MCW2286876.1 hypothetical protein [Rhodoblastus acidophilus]MCW2335733.1 hypothetical protein [Rhodoblastus acidophilus]